MLRQYGAQRHSYVRVGRFDRPIGTIPVGTITTYQGQKIIVEAWFPRTIGAGRRVEGKWCDAYMARGGHLALVRGLRDGRRFTLSDIHLRDD